MELAVQITFHNLEPSGDLQQWVQTEAAKLDKYYGRITSCRVLIEMPHAHRSTGNTYNVRIDLGVPGDELVVKYESTLRAPSRGRGDKRQSRRMEKEEGHKNPRAAVTTAFKLARRQLEDFSRKLRGEVKTHVRQPHAEMKATGPDRLGHVLRLFPEKGFGFLESPDGREIYFHRNAVIGEEFENLKLGEPVKFNEEPGEKGPHATIVKVA